MNETARSKVVAEAGTAGRFAVVGAVATATHAGVAVTLLNTNLLNAFPANIVGFLVAFAVSFSGHHFWSFAATHTPGQTFRRIRRFFLLAISGFALNSGVLASWLAFTPWPDTLGILFAIAVVPALTFLGARFWAFSAPQRGL